MLDPVVESLDTVDEKYHDLYQEADGKHVLRVNSKDGWSLENVNGLKSALAEERKAKSDYEAKLKAFEGLEPDKARDALARIEKLASGEPDEQAKQALKAYEDKLRQRYEAESKSVREPLEKAQAEAQSLRTQLQSVLIDRAALESLSKANGVPELLMPHVRAKLALKEQDGKLITVVMGDDGETPRISPVGDKSDLMTVDELVAEMKSDPVFQRAFNGNPNTGTAGRNGQAPKPDTEGAVPNVRQYDTYNKLGNLIKTRS
jgi:hypothetical protein